MRISANRHHLFSSKLGNPRKEAEEEEEEEKEEEKGVGPLF